MSKHFIQRDRDRFLADVFTEARDKISARLEEQLHLEDEVERLKATVADTFGRADAADCRYPDGQAFQCGMLVTYADIRRHPDPMKLVEQRLEHVRRMFEAEIELVRRS